MPSVIMLNVTYKPCMLRVVILSVIMLAVTYKPSLLSVVMLNVVMPNVVMLNVVKLSVAAPRKIICHQNENGCRQSDVSLKLISVTGK